MKFPLLTLTLLLLLGSFTPLVAQQRKADSLSTEAKIDSIYRLTQKIYREAQNDPLAEKRFGVEFNFFRLLLIDEAVTLSGGFSLFNADRRAEIAFPFYFADPANSDDLHEWTIDCHYRYFLGNTRNGFYLSAFGRFAHLSGYPGDDEGLFWEGEPDRENRITQDKFGFGFGLGYRKFSYRGLYWGTSFSFGRYLSSDNDQFYGEFLTLDDDGKYILDVELLKFGWAF